MKYLFFLTILLFVPADSYSKMYKCTDSNGKTVYQTHECTGSIESEVISEKEFGVDYKVNESKYDFTESTDENYKFQSRFRKIKTISKGERVNIRRYLVNGVNTAFYFYADWCGSCKKVGPMAEQTAQNSDNLALRKIDITKQDSPVKDQYGIKGIPYFILFDENGNEVSRGSRLSF